jgi:hypothetical protein
MIKAEMKHIDVWKTRVHTAIHTSIEFCAEHRNDIEQRIGPEDKETRTLGIQTIETALYVETERGDECWTKYNINKTIKNTHIGTGVGQIVAWHIKICSS